MASPHGFPTLPNGSANDRGALIGALAFVEGIGIGSIGGREMRNWIEAYLVRAGHMDRPTHLTEPMAGTMLVDALTGPAATPQSKSTLDRILGRARARVILTLSGLVQTPQNDSFLQGFVASKRVQQVDAQNNVWVARPRIDDPLSDIVLTLFAADVLSNRALYDQNLCVCGTCGRISFRAKSMARTACREHNDPGSNDSP